MGNWRTVEIIGECDPGEVAALRAAIDPGEDYKNFHCLSGGEGLCGLGWWAAARINRTGNLAERDYTPGDVQETLTNIVKTVPSLRVKVHCGGERESTECVGTVILDHTGIARLEAPEVRQIGEVSDEQITGNLMKTLMKGRRIQCTHCGNTDFKEMQYRSKMEMRAAVVEFQGDTVTFVVQKDLEDQTYVEAVYCVPCQRPFEHPDLKIVRQ